jgi:hypothetical protein
MNLIVNFQFSENFLKKIHIIKVLYIPWILRINLFKPTNPKDELL